MPHQSIVVPSLNIGDETEVNSGTKGHNIVGPVVGGVVGGLAFIGIVVAAIVFWGRRDKNKEDWEPPMFVPDAPNSRQEISHSNSMHPTLAHDALNESIPMLSAEASNSLPNLGQEVPPTPAHPPRQRPQPLDGFRSDLQNLRSVVHAMRADRVDPPPGYSER